MVSLLTNPVVTDGLHALLDSVLTDFWGSTGVVGAFSQAGEVAAALVVGIRCRMWLRSCRAILRCRRRCSWRWLIRWGAVVG